MGETVAVFCHFFLPVAICLAATLCFADTYKSGPRSPIGSSVAPQETPYFRGIFRVSRVSVTCNLLHASALFCRLFLPSFLPIRRRRKSSCGTSAPPSAQMSSVAPASELDQKGAGTAAATSLPAAGNELPRYRGRTASVKPARASFRPICLQGSKLVGESGKRVHSMAVSLKCSFSRPPL